MKDGLRGKDYKVKDLDVSGVVTGSINPLTKGSVWYVDKNKTSTLTGDGTTWAEAFLTITEAITAASANDIIYIAGGADTTTNYTETLTLTITQDNLKIIGPNVAHGFRTVSLRDTTCADDIITIKAHGVEICGLSFYCTTDEKSGIAIGVDADATSYHGIYIHDCYFYGTSGEYAIMTFTAPDAPDLLIENCKVQRFQTAGIKLHATRGEVRNCFVQALTAKVGIDFTHRGTLGVVAHNTVVCPNSTDTGIKITGNTDGGFIVCHNTIVNSATPLTKGVGDAGVCWNYAYAIDGTVVIHDAT